MASSHSLDMQQPQHLGCLASAAGRLSGQTQCQRVSCKLADTGAKACVMQTQVAGTTLSPNRSRIVACIVPQPSTRPSLAACAPDDPALMPLHRRTLTWLAGGTANASKCCARQARHNQTGLNSPCTAQVLGLRGQFFL